MNNKQLGVPVVKRFGYKEFLTDFQLPRHTPTLFLCDNQVVLKLVTYPMFHAHTKHIKIHHHYIRQLVDCKDISLHFKSSLPI